MSDLASIRPNKQKAVALLKKQLPDFIYDVAVLEGLSFSRVEVQTLLDGVTIGGHKIQDQQLVLNQKAAYQHLCDLVLNNCFELTQTIACKLQGLAAKEEALEWGAFRSGQVTIAGTDYQPPKADQLPALWSKLESQFLSQSNINNSHENNYKAAIYVFLEMAKNQFFFDGNKRTGRLMMNGCLLSQGLPAISIPAARQQTFNQLMIDFYNSTYTTADYKPMTDFMIDCLPEVVVEIMSE